MKKQLVIIGIISMLVCIGLSGCTTTDKDKFIGTWKSTKSENSAWTIKYSSDGTIISTNGVTTRRGTWEINDGKISLTMSDDQTPSSYYYSFSDNDKTLTVTSITSGIPAVYTKQ
jgi:hypothetical protein